MTPEEVSRGLTDMFRTQADTASADQRASVRRWQSKDRFYQQVQRAAAQETDVFSSIERSADIPIIYMEVHDG